MYKKQVVSDLKLSSGKHESIDNGACVMELVSYLANEQWSDHPRCVCETLTTYAIRLNDSGGAEMRARLKELAPKLVGTRDGKRQARADFLVLRAITVLLPILTDALGLEEISARLREFKAGEWEEAAAFIRWSKSSIVEAADDVAYEYTSELVPSYSTTVFYATLAAAEAAAAAAVASRKNKASNSVAVLALAAASLAVNTAEAVDAASTFSMYEAQRVEGEDFWLKIHQDVLNEAFKSLEQAINIDQFGKVA